MDLDPPYKKPTIIAFLAAKSYLAGFIMLDSYGKCSIMQMVWFYEDTIILNMEPIAFLNGRFLSKKKKIKKIYWKWDVSILINSVSKLQSWFKKIYSKK